MRRSICCGPSVSTPGDEGAVGLGGQRRDDLHDRPADVRLDGKLVGVREHAVDPYDAELPVHDRGSVTRRLRERVEQPEERPMRRRDRAGGSGNVVGGP